VKATVLIGNSVELLCVTVLVRPQCSIVEEATVPVRLQCNIAGRATVLIRQQC